jgi:hypothetical protein
MLENARRANSGDFSSSKLHLRDHGVFREANSAEERLPLASLLLMAGRGGFFRRFPCLFQGF